MILYEVNLKIDQDVYAKFLPWLEEHVTEMLTFKGFIEAKFLKLNDSGKDDGTTHLTVVYTLESMSDLQHYLDNNSQHMREDGLNKFPGKFTATRRVFSIDRVLVNKDSVQAS